MIYPFIMAGGSGRRLWPLSKENHPKQFLPLLGEHSLLQDSYRRVEREGYAQPAVIASEEHRFLVAQHLQDIDAQGGDIILEAAPRSTAFTAAIAALAGMEKDPKALILLLPCDTYIEDMSALHTAVYAAQEHARSDKIVTFGVTPSAPKTGYGYIHHARGGEVLAFTEKPDEDTAKAYIEQGDYLWNAGMFLFSAQHMLREMRMHAPDVLDAAEKSWGGRSPDLDFLRLPVDVVAQCPNISIDYAVLEKTEHAHVVKLDTGWSDIGSWHSLWAQRDKDDDGNAVQGAATLTDVQNTIVHAAKGTHIAALGIENLAIIADEDSVLVADLSKAEHVGEIAKRIERSTPPPRQVWRPWGNYKIVSQGERYVVKRLTINPGAALSLQYHNHRAEHWVVVKGAIKVQKGEETFELRADQSVYIPIGTHHRIENEGTESAEVIEVQTGDYLAEDDIVRLKG
jgi:mannose-1-phosphate guanylyltransferase/mannose-6-phosphate isomerase